MALCSVSLQQRMCVSVHVWTLFKLFTKGMGLLNVVIDTADVMSESVEIARKMFLSHFFFLMLFKPVCMCKHRFFKFFFPYCKRSPSSQSLANLTFSWTHCSWFSDDLVRSGDFHTIIKIDRRICPVIIVLFNHICRQVEEFAHINGWEAYPEEGSLTDKPSSKTSSRVSTPVAEVDSKKAEAEVVKTEAKPEKKDQAEEIKPEPMEMDKDEAGMECRK